MSLFFKKGFFMRRILLFYMFLLSACASLYPSQKDIPQLIFNNLETEYIDEQIKKLQQLGISYVVPGETLLIYFERLPQCLSPKQILKLPAKAREFRFNICVGRPEGTNRPHINPRYQKNNEARLILDDIAKYLDDQFQEPILSQYVERLDVGRLVLLSFTEEHRKIGRPHVWNFCTLEPKRRPCLILDGDKKQSKS